MKNLFCILMIALPLTIFCQPVRFMKTFGGSQNDFAYSVRQTTDGGYIISGQTDSFGGASSGKADMWVIKLDPRGEIEWEKTYGGAQGEAGFCIQQTPDEGYIVAGTTSSFGKGYPSAWIVKLDNRGDTLWTRLFEGSMVSDARSLKRTSDGGYIVAGRGEENILKLDKDGKKEWGRRYGWIFNSIDTIADGGYILGGDSIYRQLEWDYLPSLVLVKIDKDGRLEWRNPFGVNFIGSANSVIQAKDGGYIIAGDSIALKTEYDHSHYLMVCKIDKNGMREWTYYGSEYSEAMSVSQTSGEDFIVSGNMIDAGHGLDVLLIKLDKTGKKVWSKTFGESDGWEYPSDARQTSDNGYIVAGQADSYGAGRYDWWVLKLDENGNGPGSTGIPDVYKSSFTLFENYPDPFTNYTTIPFYLPEPGFISLKIFNIYGEEIESIASHYYPSGEFREVWKPKGQSCGIYIYRLQFDKMVQSKKMFLQN
jgi:hypothetical protein